MVMKNIKKLVIATHNLDKKKEMAPLLINLGLEVFTLDKFPKIGEIEESGLTLLENALIKSRAVSKYTGLPALSDDTGLEVDALNGAPGVYSARYAGENVSYEENVDKLLFEMSQINNESRTARFRTVMSFSYIDFEFWTEGVVEGIITKNKIGESGFGYDPVFKEIKTGKTFAQMTNYEKNQISHRGIALKKMCILLNKQL